MRFQVPASLKAAILTAAILIGAIPALAGETVVAEGRAIGGIRAGMSTDRDVMKKFGKNFELVSYGTYSKKMDYADRGISFFYCAGDAKKRIFSIQLEAPFRARTDRGIVLGESLVRDVKLLYGIPKDEGAPWLRYGDIEFRTSAGNDDEAQYSREDTDVVKQISVYQPGFTLCTDIYPTEEDR